MPDFDPNQPRWTGEAALSQEERFASPDRSGPLRNLKAMGRAGLAQNAQDLKERMFGEKSQVDFTKLSLQQQKQAIEKAVAVEKITAGSHAREMETRRAVSAAAAIEKLGALDHADPKFEQKLTKVLAEHPEALNSQSLMQAVSGAQSNRVAYNKALHERTAASFGNPLAKAAYEKTLAETKDPHLANIAAEATAQRVDKAKTLYGSADLTPEDRAKIFDPSKGTFNFDQLDQLEMTAAQRKVARETAGKQQNVSPLVAAMKHVEAMTDDGKDPKFTQWLKDTKFNLQEGLKNASYNAMNATTPTTAAAAPAAAADPFQKLTGAGLVATSADAAKVQQGANSANAGIVGTPQQAATIQQAAASGAANLTAPTPTPAPTPIVTAAAPSGDLADRWANGGMPAGTPAADAMVLNDPRFAQAGQTAAAPAPDVENDEEDEDTES
jgi:hypothetical protein